MTVPKNIKDNYCFLVQEIEDLKNKMNNIYDTIDNIKMYQKKFLEKELELDENLNGKCVEYIYIDRFGDHSFRKRKVENGKWEPYKDELLSIK